MIHVAIAAILNDENEILLTQRLPGTPKAGYWGLPGGKVEMNETAAHALQRECLEELNITLKDIQPLIRYLYHYATYTVDLDVFLCRAYEGTPVGLEGQAIAWYTPTTLNTIEFLDAGKTILKALQWDTQ